MKELYTSIKLKIKWVHIIILYIIQIGIFQFMVRYTFAIISSYSNEHKLFDMMKSGYNMVEVKATLDGFSELARTTYLYIQIPIDFVYPCIMALVMIFIFVKTTRKHNIFYFILPILFILADWIENICIINFLTTEDLSNIIVKISSVCTQTKSILGDYVLHYILIAFVILYFIRILTDRIKNNNHSIK